MLCRYTTCFNTTLFQITVPKKFGHLQTGFSIRNTSFGKSITINSCFPFRDIHGDIQREKPCFIGNTMNLCTKMHSNTRGIGQRRELLGRIQQSNNTQLTIEVIYRILNFAVPFIFFWSYKLYHTACLGKRIPKHLLGIPSFGILIPPRQDKNARSYGIGFTNLIYNFIAILDLRFCAIIRHGVGQASNFFAYTVDLQAGCLSIGAKILFNLGLDLMQ